MNKKNESVFFEAVCNSLLAEDKELSSLFQNNSPLYNNQHNGISCLYETTIVYLVFKELMRNKFPLSVSWEYPYPHNYALKADMALMNAACSLILKKINDTKSDFHVLVKKFHSHVHWFHNDRQSKVKGQGKIMHIAYLTNEK